MTVQISYMHSYETVEKSIFLDFYKMKILSTKHDKRHHFITNQLGISTTSHNNCDEKKD